MRRGAKIVIGIVYARLWHRIVTIFELSLSSSYQSAVVPVRMRSLIGLVLVFETANKSCEAYRAYRSYRQFSKIFLQHVPSHRQQSTSNS